MRKHAKKPKRPVPRFFWAKSRLLLLLAGLAFAPFSAWADEASATQQPETLVPSVTVARVVQAEMIGRVPVSGTLVPRDEVLIYPQVNGSTIDSLSVDVGDKVRAGDMLATLDAKTLTAQLASAEAERSRSQASVDQMESQIISAVAVATRASAALNRAQRLKDAGSATQAFLDQAIADSQTADAAVASARDGLAVAEAQLQEAQAQLEIARLNVSRTTLLAPVDGLISARNGQVGAIAASGGEPIFRIIEDGIIEIEAEVIETALGQVTMGDLVELSIAGVGPMQGTVRRIAPTVDPVNRLGTIRVEPAEQTNLRSGIFASGWVITETHTASAVPTSAVLIDASGAFVLIVKDDILEKRSVTPGLIWNGMREILSGVTAGETVVAKAGSFFGDGDRITAIISDEAPQKAATK